MLSYFNDSGSFVVIILSSLSGLPRKTDVFDYCSGDEGARCVAAAERGGARVYYPTKAPD
jgi:hypothetical protein